MFEPEYGVDQSPLDPTKITQIILYFDEPDTIELKRLAKEAMKVEFPETFMKEANLSNLYLHLLKKYYGKNNIEGAPVGQGVRSQMGPQTTDNGFF